MLCSRDACLSCNNLVVSVSWLHIAHSLDYIPEMIPESNCLVNEVMHLGSFESGKGRVLIHSESVCRSFSHIVCIQGNFFHE